MTLLDGKKTSQKIRERLKKEIIKLKQRDIIPGLAVVLVGNDPASKIYVNNKKKACEKIGIYSTEYTLDESTSQENIFRVTQSIYAEYATNIISPIRIKKNELNLVFITFFCIFVMLWDL